MSQPSINGKFVLSVTPLVYEPLLIGYLVGLSAISLALVLIVTLPNSGSQ